MTHQTFSIKEALSFGWRITKDHYWFLLQAVFLGALVLGAAMSTGPFAALALLAVALGAISLTLPIIDGKKIGRAHV